ncbi:MAG TPA: hypothetical protein VHV55_22495 [Pirellulales bacterium]|nr:hypothetical protein [Pirellulales bacterium]
MAFESKSVFFSALFPHFLHPLPNKYWREKNNAGPMRPGSLEPSMPGRQAMRTTTYVLAGCLVLSVTSSLRAQGYPVIGMRPTEAMACCPATTAAEGYLRGQAQLAQAQGAQMLLQSLALIGREGARRIAIENEQARVKACFAMREENRRARAAERVSRSHSTPIPRFSAAPSRVISPIGPAGTIKWPSVLEAEPFAGHRAKLDTLAAEHATTQHLSRAEGETVRQVCRAMTDELKSHIHELNSKDFITGNQFVRDLRDTLGSLGADAQLAGQ